MNQASAQVAVRPVELGDQIAKMWEARFAAKFRDAAGPRRWDPESAQDSASADFASLSTNNAAGTMVVPSRELAGRRSFDQRGRGQKALDTVRLVLDATPRPSMTFAPYLLA